jgi:hypothetical protein
MMRTGDDILRFFLVVAWQRNILLLFEFESMSLDIQSRTHY